MAPSPAPILRTRHCSDGYGLASLDDMTANTASAATGFAVANNRRASLRPITDNCHLSAAVSALLLFPSFPDKTAGHCNCLTSNQLVESKLPHYHGHRQRLRERFLASGFTGFADHEVVELLLTLC